MNIYIFDEETKEYLYTEEADLDPVATERLGQPVPLVPANGTTEALPAKLKANHTWVFEKGSWVQTPDFRGTLVVSEDFVSVETVDYLGAIKDGFAPITEEQLEILRKDPLQYTWTKKGLKTNTNYDKDVDTKKKELRKQEILDELDDLDMKSIRALRTNDQEYLAKYEEQAEVLRKELNSL
jgi:hypothetical protein